MISVNEKVIYIGPAYMPDGSVVPELMTEEEAIACSRPSKTSLFWPAVVTLIEWIYILCLCTRIKL